MRFVHFVYYDIELTKINKEKKMHKKKKMNKKKNYALSEVL